jgi:hypothetical protein
MAIPLRKSLAAGMGLRRDWLQHLHRYNVEALKRYSGRARSLHASSNIATVILSEAVAKSKDPAEQP